jgi:DNA double-strand break repair helicase HerA and related ATPase
MPDQSFATDITAAYGFTEPVLEYGAASHAGTADPAVRVRVPLRMVNRHGLVAGATGTGKTKTLQVLTEQLSDLGVPVFLVDIKGDISGLGAPGQANDRITARLAQVGENDWAARGFPVEFMTLGRDTKGTRLRATVSSFGPILLAKVLELNETQQSVLALVFKYADDQKLPLVDLSDLRSTLNYLNGDVGQAAMAEYGGLATATVGVMIRKIVELEQQGADAFFGQPEFNIDDLIRLAPDGRGVVSVLEVADMQDRPKLFSTFMMWLLAAVYHHLPEVGDPDKPKLVFFLDEAHLLFEGANPSFLDQIEMVARLIRSKGVGVYFVTQSPSDVPPTVLAQLGNRVQHALRAFTPDDQKRIDQTARTFPSTTYYDVGKELTSLGTGEALITVMSPSGVPTPTVHTVLRPPRSLMAQLDPAAFDAAVVASPIAGHYAADIDPDSAKEMLAARMEQAAAQAPPAPIASAGAQAAAVEGMDWSQAAKVGVRVLTSSTTNTLLRGVFGILGGTTSRRTTRRR